MPRIGSSSLGEAIVPYGIPHDALRELRGMIAPELLDYLDLLPRKDETEQPNAAPLPDAVVESQGKPLLFVINESRLAQAPREQEIQLAHLRRKLACRGDRAFLARIRPGELAVVPVSLDERTPAWTRYTPGTPQALTFFSRLAQGRYDGEDSPRDADNVFSAMFKLVWSVADRLATLNLKRTDVLSLMGRALFFRFLRDRRIIHESDCSRISPRAANLQECFSDAETAARTSAWLDLTFNGDLLPLTDDGNAAYFDRIGRQTGGKIFLHLAAILRGEEPVGDRGWQTLLPLTAAERNWGTYDFAHVPVGLLSQVYERFAWKWEHKTAKVTSVHYTPRNIAATMVDEAFSDLPAAARARVLDPACGASVFLVLAFRRLYQERWKSEGRRPGTKAIREILETQITGFDISESALRLGALSLYLTALELDPKPVPLSSLAFTNLRGKVLFNFRREGEDPEQGAVAGSLAPHVGARFDARFDLVLSNPPWTSLEPGERALAAEFNDLSKAVIARRAGPARAEAYENPDSCPDLPFVWKSTEWCKPGGRLAFALPARVLLKQEAIPAKAREILFQNLEVTGIINGTNLRKTRVWPEVDQPFLLLFACNRVPSGEHVLKFITPYPDIRLNGIGVMRVDPNSVQTVEARSVAGRPWLWKALSLGTALDVDVIDRIRAAGGLLLNTQWTGDYANCQGYKVAFDDEQQDARSLKILPDLHSPKSAALETPDPRFAVAPERLRKFSRDTLHRPRLRKKGDPLRIYRAPLVLVRASPPDDRAEGRALLSLADVAYNESYYGYSAPDTPEGELAARYLHLFVHTSLWLYYAMLTSGEIGVERPKFQKRDLDGFPLVPPERLAVETRKKVAALSRRLIIEDLSVFDEIDALFAELHGLDRRDLEVIADTLELRAPNDEMGNRASETPISRELQKFKIRLEGILRPFFKVMGEEPHIDLWKPDASYLQQQAPFRLLLISRRGTPLPAPDDLFRKSLMELAKDTGSTRIIQEVEGGLVVALINQYRYWTPSRARLLGVELIREHLEVFDR